MLFCYSVARLRLQYECSYHQGNRFISLLVRVFKPPTKSSGQLLDTEAFVAQNIEGGFLVELQLQQGDRLYFSSLFRDMILNFTKVRLLLIMLKNRYQKTAFLIINFPTGFF